MIDFLIALLVTISSGGNPCDLGTPVNWYEWTDAHPTAELVVTFNLPENDLWLWNGDGDYVLFKFREDVESAQTVDAHGECAVRITP